MPKHSVTRVAEQDALFEQRHLLPPSDAAVLLGISRQAVEKSAARLGGQILVWAFDGTAGGRRYRPSYVDFGPRAGQPNPNVWQQYRDDPWAIVRQAVQEALDSRPTSGKVPGSIGGDLPSLDVRRPNEDDSLLILQLVASGLAQFGRRVGENLPQFLPYPEPLQKGLDKLTVNGLRYRSEAPASVPDLLAWCRNRPVSEWPLRLHAGVAGPSDRLLDGPQLTTFCQELALGSRDVESEVVERRLLHSVIAACRQASDQSSYVAFRRLLIESPVLTTLQLHTECARPELSRLAEEVRSVYAPVPLEYAIRGVVRLCGRCGNLLFRSPTGTTRCTDDRCAAQAAVVGRSIPLSEDPLWLELPFRTFISAPGRAELRLAERLGRLGLDVELWPDIDAYDMRITFPGGESWAIDVKDWVSPVALAHHLDRSGDLFPHSPAWQRAYFVFPQERLQQRPDYVRAFAYASRKVEADPLVEALGETTFIAETRRTLKSGMRSV